MIQPNNIHYGGINVFELSGLGYALNQTYIACEGCMEYICKSRACDDRDGSKHKVRSSWRHHIELFIPSCGGSWTLWPASAARTGRAGSFLLTRYRQGHSS